MSTEYDIIIPHHGCTQELHDLVLRCLESIREYSDHDAYRLIFIDNGTPSQLYTEFLDSELTRHHGGLIRNDENLGFVKAANQGLKASTAPYVVLMNNDCEAAPQWLEKLRSPLVGNVGISGPRSTAREQWQGKHWARKPYLLPPDEILAFFCAMIRRDVIDKIGYLDEAYGIGLGDDTDYCKRASAAGFRLALAGDLVIPHRSRTTFRALYSEGEIAALRNAAYKMLIDGPV